MLEWDRYEYELEHPPKVAADLDVPGPDASAAERYAFVTGG